MSEPNIEDMECMVGALDHWIQRAEKAEARVAELEKPWRAVDDMDWEYIFSAIGHGGRDQFWRSVLTEMRLALAGRAG